MSLLPIDVHPRVHSALREGRAVVALESTLIAHGLPWPINVETARAAEEAVRQAGAEPATIAVLRGRPTIGLEEDDLAALGRPGAAVRKASRRDLAAAMSQRATAATTVAATMLLAHRAGIRVFATGGIGGVHPAPLQIADCRLQIERQPSQAASSAAASAGNRQSAICNLQSWDVSADLNELARTPVAVVCAGAKSILDLAATLEVLETNGVPVVGYGTDEFPAFYLRSSGLPVSARVDTPGAAARLLKCHWALQGAGVVIAQPPPLALEPEELAQALNQAQGMAAREGVRGAALTPLLLSRLAEVTQGKTLQINAELIVANARLAAQVACAGQGE
jgi:pseudouridine-5'-phosphate glycosidase